VPAEGPAERPGDGAVEERRADERARLHAPFRPRRGPFVAWVIGAVALVGAVLLAIHVPGDPTPGDRAGFVLLGVAGAWFMQRQATVAAVPGESGLLVRNLVERRTVAWAEIVEVRFGGGRPWVQLDLADGDTLAVMGVQRADGPRAEREARRLATLVALHTRTERDD
jgi:MYXO-CTERM domain-containing protein